MMIVKDMAATAIVAASSTTRGIGWNGKLPWNTIKEDMAYFKKVTSYCADESKQNAVVMGRHTWESIPEKFRPLSGRTNVVVTTQTPSTSNSSSSNNNPSTNSLYPPNVLIANSLRDAWQQLGRLENLNEIFVIGGSQLYQQAVDECYIHKVLMTKVDTPNDMQFDTFFPSLNDKEWKLVVPDEDKSTTNDNDGKNVINKSDPNDSSSILPIRFETYVRPNHEEEQYLNLIDHVMKEGTKRGDRTGTGTLSVFGTQMRFSLRNGQLPLLTTKKTFWRGVAEELLWFISGSTNSNLLSQKGVKIWDANGSKEFLEGRGLGHREEGDLGPVYGFQWRHFGAKYVDMHTNYTGQGVDQLQECIDKIKNNPEDRRIIMSAWNPSDLSEMALPPCHVLCQFYVDTNKNEVSCQLYQRSADLGLGVPFNIASYALLTHLIATITGRKPGDFVYTLGDAHVYLNHIEPLQVQLQRTPRPFPKLYMKEGSEKKSIDDITMDDFDVVGYHPYPAVKMNMAV